MQACKAVHVHTLHSSHSIMDPPSSFLAPHTQLTSQPSLMALFLEKCSLSCMPSSSSSTSHQQAPWVIPMTETILTSLHKVSARTTHVS